MRKEELIKQVAESTGIAICEVRTVIEAALKAFNAAMYFSDIKDGLYDKAKGFFEYELDKDCLLYTSIRKKLMKWTKRIVIGWFFGAVLRLTVRIAASLLRTRVTLGRPRLRPDVYKRQL